MSETKYRGLWVLLGIVSLFFLYQNVLMSNYFVFGFGTRAAMILRGLSLGSLLALDSGGIPAYSSVTFVDNPIWSPRSCSRRSILVLLPSIAISTGAIGLLAPRNYYKQILVGSTGIVGVLTLASFFGAPSAIARFILFLEVIGVCTIGIAVAKLKPEQRTKVAFALVCIFISLLVGTQLVSADAAPDYENCERRYLTQSELTAKEWGGSHSPAPVTTNYFYSDNKLHPVGNHQPGLNRYLANKSIQDAVSNSESIAYWGSADVYSMGGEQRVRFTYDPEARLDNRSSRIYANGKVTYYSGERDDTL